MKLRHEPKTGAMNSPLGTLKILLLLCSKWSLSPLILAIKGKANISKLTKELGNMTIPTKAAAFLLGSATTQQVGSSAPSLGPVIITLPSTCHVGNLLQVF